MTVTSETLPSYNYEWIERLFGRYMNGTEENWYWYNFNLMKKAALWRPDLSNYHGIY